MPEKISASKVRTFLQCARKYDDQYNGGNYPDPSQPATQSSIAHQVIAIGYEHKLATGKDMDIQEKLNHVDVLFKEDYEHGNTQYRDSVEDVIRETREMVQIHHEDIAVRVDPFLIEKSFEVDVEGIKLVGIQDLLKNWNG